ncbi:MAG: cytochrome c3 family protein [Planctomycetota bacterium]|jgi:predicted CXXCH cytochrome family protein
MAAQLGSRLKHAVVLSTVGLAGLFVLTVFGRPPTTGEQPPAETSDEDVPEIDPLGPNSACYVCHIPFVREELGRDHLREKITCIDCHGLSAGHANDEDVGATPPDKTYQRHQVDASCAECHEEHDVPAKQIIARFLERKPPKRPAVCTDCHGTHKIERAQEEEKNDPSADAAPDGDDD